MGTIEDIYADLDAEGVTEEEFRAAVEAKVEEMDGLVDEKSAAMLIAHEVGESEVNGIADIKPGMEEAKFVGKVLHVGDLRTFEREEGEDGRVLNIEVADETGRVRVALWDEQADAGVEELEPGQVLRIAGRPKEGYNGLEISADRVEGDPDTEIDVEIGDAKTIEGLTIGQSDVTLKGLVLDTEPVRTFSRNDGSEGRVANLVLGDETGRVRVTLWDEQTDLVEQFEAGTSVEVIDGYVRERDDNLELHVGNRGTIEALDERIEYVPETTDIAALELGTTADIAGVVRSADPKRTFDRDDGSQGQVRNIRLQDQTGDIRVALWSEKADLDIGPGDEVLVADAEIKDGWQEDLEASAGWRSTVTVLEGSAPSADSEPSEASKTGGLSAFADGESPTSTDSTDEGDGEEVTFTGVVVQPGDPVILDGEDDTMTVVTSQSVNLGQEVTVRGTMRDGKLHADDVF
jgi:ssDNA-binding replication factor A large subunit